MKELKESILRIHNLMRTVNEEKISDLPPDIQKAIQKMENDFGVDITDNHISKELEQEGGWQKDSGGEDPQARKQIEKLISSAKSEFGDRIPSKSIVSGYRSYGDQVRNFGNKAQKRGVDNTQTSNAIPGFSQHHNGKTFDIFSVETSWWNQNLDIKDWVANNCDDFGFKVTYKTKGPLRIAEPWHLTYIGGEKKEDKQPVTDEEVDAYFFSERVDEKLEKTIEKQYPKKGCKASSNFTDSPSLEKVEKGLEVIRIGHQGEEVEKIQQRLYDKGYDLGPCGVDGLFGTRTKKALEKFQEDNSMEISSSVDSKVLKKLSSGGKSTLKKSEEKKKEEKKTEDNKVDVKKVDKGSYDEYKFTGYTILVPKNYKSKNVHVLFCGMSTPANTVNFGNLYLDAVNPLLNKVAVVITHSYHSGGFEGFVDIVQNFLIKKGFDLKINSIAGFSRGGNAVWPHVGKRSNFKFVGLIDPSTREYDVDFGNNTIMECNPNEWGGPGSGRLLYKTLAWYCKHKDDPKYSGKVFCVNKSHSGIMKTFYQNYGSRI